MLTKFLSFIFLGLMFIASVVCAAEADTSKPQVSHVRSLAASCAACHGTQGNSTGITPSISSLYKPYFVSQMLAFKSGQRPATVMHRHAKGLTEQEISDLADYFSAQARQPVKVVPHQSLSEDYLN